ncbi:MAG: long-chain fatty acid--CoA ligase [Deltaproteobacteria bacterium]|nr:long-chain fatty acid--CoA ligase [Deltaproteobacteria bacterium]
MSDKLVNLAQLCERACDRFSDRPLFGTKDGDSWSWITYAEFHEQVAEVRGGLAALGVEPGDKVAVIADNRIEWAATAYATYGRRATCVPMYQAQKPDEWRFILDDCGAKAVFVATPEIHEKLTAMKQHLPALEHVIGFDLEESNDASYLSLCRKGRSAPVQVLQAEAGELAGYIYTSGTTGNPKGVMLSHQNICSNVEAVEQVFPLAKEDRSLSFLPWAHAFGQTCELHVLVNTGASLALNDAIPNLIGNLAEVKPTILYAVPRIFNKLYDKVMGQIREKPAAIQKLVARGLRAANAKKEGKSAGILDRAALSLAEGLVFKKVRERFGGRLKYAISGSAALSVEVARFIDALDITVYEGYGLSETSPIATANYPGARKMGSVGKAIPGVRIEIDTSATGDEKLGEIIIHGPNVMQGYHNRPEEQAKVFTSDGGLRSGDTGYIDDEGFLYIRGRIKEQYKLENGKYVMPAPLEEMLKLSPYVAHVMLDGSNRPYNIAVVVPEAEALGKWAKEKGVDVGKPSDSAEVKELLEQELKSYSGKFKGYEKPRGFIVVDEEFTTDNGMLTPTMKLKRAKVLEKYQSQIDALYS